MKVIWGYSPAPCYSSRQSKNTWLVMPGDERLEEALNWWPEIWKVRGLNHISWCIPRYLKLIPIYYRYSFHNSDDAARRGTYTPLTNQQCSLVAICLRKYLIPEYFSEYLLPQATSDTNFITSSCLAFSRNRSCDKNSSESGLSGKWSQEIWTGVEKWRREIRMPRKCEFSNWLPT